MPAGEGTAQLLEGSNLLRHGGLRYASSLDLISLHSLEGSFVYEALYYRFLVNGKATRGRWLRLFGVDLLSATRKAGRDLLGLMLCLILKSPAQPDGL